MKYKFTLLASAFSFLLNAQTAPSYYNGINFNQSSGQLKDALEALVTNTHTKVISYSELKTLLAVSDVDPDNPQNLLLIYGSGTANDTHQRSRNKNGSWNREHVYAKSKGTPNLGTSGPGADGHHLRPADIQLNSTRGSLLFDDGTGIRASKTSRGGWYPGEEWKGDVARILMYMYLRYENRAKPLNIAYGPSTYSSDFSDILLKWNVEDPVSQFEIQRNNIVAATQKNRNPFIDNPYLATVIWGGPAAQNTWPDSFNGTGGTTDIEAPTAPTNLALVSKTTNSVTINWTASTDNVAVNNYEVYIDNVLKATTSTNNATITNLAPATAYNFHIIAKDTSGNKSSNSDILQVTTESTGDPGEVTTCGTEEFNDIPTSSGSSYIDRSWTTNGITWNATFARTDKSGYIDGDANKAICIKKGSLKSSTITGGIKSLSVRTYLPFSDSNGNYILKINGVEKGLIPYSKTPTNHTISDLDIEGNVVIELVDTVTNNRVAFDNLTWSCYTKLSTSEVKTQKLTVYPNPTKNKEIFIEGIKGSEAVKIYNMNGQLVQTINNVNNKQKLVLKNLPKGIYILKTKDQSSKVIID